ncbi:hypothetical protein J6W78_08405 [bacterium]|nr:hypothetical protein [bacterium]
MFSFLFALFLAFSAENPVCQSRFETAEELYKSIILHSDDISVRRQYLKKFGSCISEEGINIIEEKNIVIVEELDCTNPLDGIEFFFRNKKLCSRSVTFFPSKKVFTAKKKTVQISLPENWKHIETAETTLFYDSTAKFEENSDTTGQILAKSGDGIFTNHLGKVIHPEFIYAKGNWEKVFPLRELFSLKINKDNSFDVKIITENRLPYEKKELFELLDIKADSTKEPSFAPSSCTVKGKDLKGIRIPKTEYLADKESDHGTYKISLHYPDLQKKEAVTAKTENYELNIIFSDGSLEATLTVFVKKLTPEEALNIRAAINREIPAFFVQTAK